MPSVVKNHLGLLNLHFDKVIVQQSTIKSNLLVIEIPEPAWQESMAASSEFLPEMPSDGDCTRSDREKGTR